MEGKNKNNLMWGFESVDWNHLRDMHTDLTFNMTSERQWIIFFPLSSLSQCEAIKRNQTIKKKSNTTLSSEHLQQTFNQTQLNPGDILQQTFLPQVFPSC